MELERDHQRSKEKVIPELSLSKNQYAGKTFRWRVPVHRLNTGFLEKCMLEQYS